MANPNFRPLGDRVLVQPLEEGEVKKGGIIIPDTAKEKVLISKYGGTEIKIDGTAFQVLREDDILGILA
jgi:chaperonin GroES